MKSFCGKNSAIVFLCVLWVLSVILVFLVPQGLIRSSFALVSFGILGGIIWRLSFREIGAFDRVISGGYWRQIGLLAIIVVYVLVSCVCSFMLAGITEVSNETNTIDQIVSVIHRFMGYNYYNDDATEANVFLLVASIFGTLILTGLLVTTFSNIIQQRKEDAEKGLVSYNLHDHYVIIGYGELAIPFIKEIFKKQLAQHSISLEDVNTQVVNKQYRKILRDLSPIVLLTNQKVDKVVREIRAQLSDQFEKKVFVYSGDMQSVEHLEKLGFDKAVAVYVLGERDELGRDSINIECIKRIREMRQKADIKNASALPVHIQLDKPTSYSTIKRLSFPPEYYGNKKETVLYVRPFNFYENCARAIWGYNGESSQSIYPKLTFNKIEKETSKHVHLVIAGFDVMGKALLLEALRICHFVNYDENTCENKTVITIIDPKIHSLWNDFRVQYQGVEMISDINIELIEDVIESPSVRKELEKYANNCDELLTVAICFYDPDYSFCAALNLPDSLFYRINETKDTTGIITAAEYVSQNDRICVLVRQQLQKGISDIIQHHNIKYKNLYVFGTTEQGVNPTAFDDTPAMWVGAFYDFKYQDKDSEKYRHVISGFEELAVTKEYLLKHNKNTFDGYNTDVSILDFALESHINYKTVWPIVQRLWYLSSEDVRFSNRYVVDAYDNYHMKTGSAQFDDSDLYRMEHLRWCADRIITGYKRYDALKKLPNKGKVEKFEYKVHNFLMPYFELLKTYPGEEDKDKDVIINKDKIIRLSKGQ